MKNLFRFIFSPALTGIFLLAASRCALGASDDPTSVSLRQLVDEIVAANPEFAFYEAELAAAKAGARTAGARPDPELSLEVGRKRSRDSLGVLAGEGATWSVSVAQVFEWPGRLALRKSIANRQVDLAELGLARFRHALVARARLLTYGLQAAHTKAASVREVADRFAALKETFLARDPAGLTPLLETRVIEASELALQRRATESEIALHRALVELNQLRGGSLEAPLRVAAVTLKLNDAPNPSTLLAAARENNFEFRMRRVELEQQGVQLRLARNERYPSISVRPYYGQENAGDRDSTFGLGVSLPLPLSTRNNRTVDVVEARRRQAETVLLMAQRDLERDVLTTAHAFSTHLAETRRWAPDAVTKFRESADLADRHYRLGTVPVATYVEMQSSYLDAVEALLDTQREALEAGLKLQQLTGLDFNPVEILP